MNEKANSYDNFALKKKAIFLSLFTGLLMLVIKITAYLITSSSAIFSDAAESIVHVIATGMAVYSVLLSAKPPDESHLYGHGNIEYFSAGIEGSLIIVAAIAIIYNSVTTIIQGTHPEELDYGTILIGIAGIINLILGLYLIRKGKLTNSLALVADGKHVLTDSYTSIGIVVGLILVLITQLYILDPVIALFVAVNILVTGYKLIRESVGGLMHETDKEMLTAIVNIFNKIKRSYWIDLHQLRFWKSADWVFIDFHLSVPYYFTVKEIHREEDFISEKISEVIPSSDVRIHFDYCEEILCTYCDYEECKYRLKPKTKNLMWDIKKVIGSPVNK